MKKLAIITILAIIITATPAIGGHLNQQIDENTWLIDIEVHSQTRTFVYICEMRGMEETVGSIVGDEAAMAVFKKISAQEMQAVMMGELKNASAAELAQYRKGCTYVHVFSHEKYGYLFTIITDVAAILNGG